MKVMNYEIFIQNLDDINSNYKQIINTINPHSYITAKKDLQFSKALNQSDILIPDGSGIVLAAKLINNQKITKITGQDLHDFLLEKMEEKNGKVFYMGSSRETLMKIEKRMSKEFPNISVSSFSPPFKSQFTEEENDMIIEKINSFDPDILFIGMTAPKQEKWLYQNKDRLNYTVACSVGAVFDFYAGTIKRPSKLWINLHLEWLIRFLKEPRRLWKRNLISLPLFLFDILVYKLKIKV